MTGNYLKFIHPAADALIINGFYKKPMNKKTGQTDYVKRLSRS